jgi:ubiquinone/menaquinone biosynthesis C-methylase UbiE
MSFEEKTEIYQKKENYITVYPDPEIWKAHPNYGILKAAKEYIHGVCGDLGCNHGSCTVFLLEYNPTSVYGFDINIKALEVAYQIASQQKTLIPMNFMCVNLIKLPQEDNFFDFLMSFHTLEHIYPVDVDMVVSEMYRVLKHGGHILLSIPYDHAYPDKCHVAYYVEDTLKELFEKHNFITIECFKDERFSEKDLLTAIFKKPDV